VDTDVQAGSIPIWLTFITFVRGRSAHAARWPVSTSVRDSLALLRSRWGDTMIPFVGGSTRSDTIATSSSVRRT